MTVVVNTSYVDKGATATDNNDYDITSSIQIENPVDTTKEGTYYVKYNVTDAVVNVADEVVRVVVVKAPEPEKRIRRNKIL